MENATDALKIAAAVFIFVAAITTTFLLISQAKDTSDYVLFYADKTNFYTHSDNNSSNRIVTASDVISTLNRYSDETIAVKVVLLNGDEYNFDTAGNTTVLPKMQEDSGVVNINDEKVREKNLEEFITEYLPKDSSYSENFVEAQIGGIVKKGEDGSEIVETSVNKKIYITYTQLPTEE